ncbi:MAG TPA: universal stress protein [Puia sp.]|uniref:universal stress protein n=1 Tax=Puia sp. TaxID=2045100 RepID=UPI002CAA727C|nr:universal stress protein [Puia sp.]HVU94119.1 universal stress protein [Puia sp.]
MKKKMHILVPTDFSPASRAGIRFAIQWSQQQNAHLTFVHVMHIVRPTRWTDKQYDTFAASERALYTKKLRAFIADIQRRQPLRPKSWSLVLLEGFNADLALIDYCREHPGIGLVCMGTKGANRTRRIFGTNTGNFILQSDKPVIAVPATYRRKPISRVTYASDLADAARELKQVVALAGPLHAKVGILHLTETGETTPDPETLKKLWKKEAGRNVTIEFRKADPAVSIAKNLQQTARTLQPSLLILFSNRRRTFFQSLLYPSNAERLAVAATVPLLVLGKEG